MLFVGAVPVHGATTTNLQLAVVFSPVVLGEITVFLVSEANQGNTDLNGDGDTADNVVHVYNSTAGTTTNVGFQSSIIPIIDGNNVAFLVLEGSQGNAPLNGDGDSADLVLHVYDIAAGTTANVGLASGSLQLDGNNVAFLVSEANEGNTDLNGDADTFDSVLHVYDIAAGTTTNVGLATSITPVIDGNNVAFLVNEFNQGNTDLNGDADTTDLVLHVYDIAAGTTANVGLATSITPVIDGNNVAFLVNEFNQGNTDLNGDADATDLVLHVYDIAAGTTANSGFASGIPVIDGNNVAFLVNEFNQGNTDLNGDADTTDTNILHVYDITAGTTANVGLATGITPVIDGNNVAFAVREFSQGNTDLNGDADTADNVLHVYDIAAGTTANVGLASTQPALDGNTLAFRVSEASQGNTDLNGDADTTDDVTHIYDLTGVTQTEQATGQVDVAQTCGLLFVFGDPINYGGVLPGDTSEEKTLTLDNTGNTDVTTLLVKGTDWLDGASTEMTVDNTRFSTASGAFGVKTTLSTTDKTITSAFSASTDLDSFWQLQANLLDSAFSGSLTQTLDFTVTC